MYEIEKDVPVSLRISHGRWTETMTAMKQGDSFFVPEEDFAPSTKQNVRMAILVAGKRAGFKMATRTVEGGLRVWRLE